jgi:hypothetical protein
MSEGQSQRSIASSAQHRQEAKVAATEERERVAAETAATAARVARLAMTEQAAARAEVEAAAAADATRAAIAELEALRDSSTGSSVSADDDRDNKLKLTREAVWEQTTLLTEIAAFIGSVTLPPQTVTMITMGSRPLSGTSVPAAGGLPSPRPTTSSRQR